MNIFFNTFYFCSFFFKGASLRASLRAGPRPSPPINGLGPGFSSSGRAGPKAGRGLFGDHHTSSISNSTKNNIFSKIKLNKIISQAL